MVKVMIYGGQSAPDAPGTRTGGLPHTPPAFEWPRCRNCTGHMQFLAQVSLADADPGAEGLLSLFMCQNEPGLCDEWDPTAGGNRAFLFGMDATATPTVPRDGVTMLDETCAVRFEDVDVEDYQDAPDQWSAQTGRESLEVLGKVGGEPAWLQNDETPACGRCARPMTFVVQLEEGHNYETAANFGGGNGYGFRCGTCRSAAFLWQR